MSASTAPPGTRPRASMPSLVTMATMRWSSSGILTSTSPLIALALQRLTVTRPLVAGASVQTGFCGQDYPECLDEGNDLATGPKAKAIDAAVGGEGGDLGPTTYIEAYFGVDRAFLSAVDSVGELVFGADFRAALFAGWRLNRMAWPPSPHQRPHTGHVFPGRAGRGRCQQGSWQVILVKNDGLVGLHWPAPGVAAHPIGGVGEEGGE